MAATSRSTVLVAVAVAVVGVAWFARSASSEASPVRVVAVHTAAEDARAGQRGAVIAAVPGLRASMHDPSSFVMDEALLTDAGAGCYSYRAKNGFGALRVGAAVRTPAGVVLTSDAPGFAKPWAVYCQKVGGESVVALAR